MESATPNFFIIGAPKCGTTSMAAWLGEHPSIYMSPIKEPFYFSSDINNRTIKEWQVYMGLFDQVRSEVAIGEASTIYLFSRVAVRTIEERLPGARYIVMLRNPAEMAYALHGQQIRAFNEDVKDFRQAWRLASERRAGRQVPSRCKDPILLDYPSWCKLGEQLERLYGWVPSERVLVQVLDDIKEDTRREYLKVLAFLGVPDEGRQHFPVHNPAREWKWRWAGFTVRRMAKATGYAKHVARILPKRSFGVVRVFQQAAARQRPRPPLPPDLRAELQGFFEEDIRKLEDLLDRDLSAWRQVKGQPQ